jgi:predicted amidohydrolase
MSTKRQLSTQLPEHPGDLFATIYDSLPDSAFAEREAETWPGRPEVRRISKRVVTHILNHGVADPNAAQEAIDKHGDAGRYAVLWGLDRALDYASPYSSLHESEKLHWLVADYPLTNRVDSGAIPGAVLFRCSYPGGPRNLPRKDTVFSLVRVPEDVWEHINLVRIPEESDVVLTPSDHGPVRVVIACVPVADEHDMEVQPVSTAAGPAYRLVLHDTEALRDRVQVVVNKLDQSGADIAVVPEGCLSDGLLKHWKDVLLSTAPPPDSRLSWLVVGTGPVGVGEPPFNRAVVLDRDGEELTVQDKEFDFTLDEEQAHRWGLHHLVGAGARFEDIQLGQERQMLESRVGRVSVLICEDLSRGIDVGEHVRACGASHALVPVFSGGLGWSIGAATNFARETGAWTVVSNSLVVRLGNDWDRTCIAVGPGDDQRESWKFGRAEADAGQPDNLSGVCIPIGRASRWDTFTE